MEEEVKTAREESPVSKTAIKEEIKPVVQSSPLHRNIFKPRQSDSSFRFSADSNKWTN